MCVSVSEEREKRTKWVPLPLLPPLSDVSVFQMRSSKHSILSFTVLVYVISIPRVPNFTMLNESTPLTHCVTCGMILTQCCPLLKKSVTKPQLKD